MEGQPMTDLVVPRRPDGMPAARKLVSRWGGYKILPAKVFPGERTAFTESEADFIVALVSAATELDALCRVAQRLRRWVDLDGVRLP